MPTLRITGGRLKGMSIRSHAGDTARYTSSKVRQAIFNTIGNIEGMSVLDLFAGSGSFSIEALSRGAASATLVESNKRMVDLIGKNLAATGLNKYCQVFHMDVRYAIPLLYGRKNAFDIIFMDPPYERGYAADAMTILEANPLFTVNTVMIVEYSRRETDTAVLFKDRAGARTRRYGDTVITVLTDTRHPTHKETI